MKLIYSDRCLRAVCVLNRFVKPKMRAAGKASETSLTKVSRPLHYNALPRRQIDWAIARVSVKSLVNRVMNAGTVLDLAWLAERQIPA